MFAKMNKLLSMSGVIRLYHRIFVICVMMFCFFIEESHAQNYRVSMPQCDTVVTEEGDGIRSFKIVPRALDTSIANTDSLRKVKSVGVKRQTSVEPSRSIPLRDYSGYSVGFIPIEESVSATGARVYSIPIRTSPGWSFVPSVSLVYNSQSGNNIAGYGWSLSGLSSITVRNSNPYYDGESKAHCDDSPLARYSLDGIPLVTSEMGIANYSMATAKGNIQIRKHTDSQGRALYFSALYPDGSTARFGYSDSTGPHTSYPITELTDINGNTIQFSYLFAGGYYYVTDISYGYNSTIHFTYSTRSDGGAYQSAFAGEYVSFPSRLLNVITVSDGNTELCHYTLVHEQLDYVSLLKEVHCLSGNADELPPLVFEYGVEDEGSIWSPSFVLQQNNFYQEYFTKTSSLKLQYHRGKLLPGDLSDGIVVLPSYKTYAQIDRQWSWQTFGYCYKYGSAYNSNQKILCNRSGSISSQTILTAGEGFQLIEALDIDGDGVDELVKINNGSNVTDVTYYTITIHKFLSGGGYTTTSFTVTVADGSHNAIFNNPVNSYYRFGRFRGDGRMMLLIMTSQYSKFAVVDLIGQSKLSEDVLFSMDGGNENNLVLVADFENDGKDDICHVTSSGMDVYSLDHVTTGHFSLRTTYTGVSKSQLYYNFGGPPAEVVSRIYVLDINGDGYLDIAAAPALNMDTGSTVVTTGTWNFSRFNGRQFVTETTSLYIRDQDDSVVFLDVDRDGLPDILHTHDSKLLYCRNDKGIFSNTFTYTQLSLDSSAELIPGDVSIFGVEGDIVVISGPEVRLYNFGIHHRAMRSLTGLSDSYGLHHFNTYVATGSHWDGYFIDETRTYDSSSGFARCRYPLHVLSGGETYRDDYTKVKAEYYYYWDEVYHSRGLGFCGFGQILMTDVVDTVYRKTRLNPEKFGVAEQITYAKTVSGTPYTVITNTYDNNSSTYGKLNPRLSSSVVSDYLSGIETTTGYYYGSYDYPDSVKTTRRITGSTSSQTEQVNRTYVHSISPSKYVLGVVTEESLIKDLDGAPILKWKERSVSTYDNCYRPLTMKKYVGRYGADDLSLPGGPLDGGQIEVRRPPDSLIIIDPDPLIILVDATNLVSETHWQYDAHGNVVSEVTAPYGATEFTGETYIYDAAGRYITSKTDALGRTMSYSGYTKFGKPSVVTDYLNHNTVYTYDNWGNVSSVSSPDGIVKQSTPAWGGIGLYTVSESATGRPDKIVHYDALGRVVRSGEKRFDGRWRYIDSEYDIKGRLSRISLPFRGDTASYWNVHAYDAYSRQISYTEASGKASTWSYNGTSVTKVQDGISSTHTTDASGNVVSVSDAGGTITYSLRDDGQPYMITAPGNISTSFSYDDYGRRIGMNDPSAGTQTDTYVWNSNGTSAVTHTGPNGTIKTYRDKYGRTTLVERPGEYNTSYTYDTVGRLIAKQSTNGTGSAFTYDGYGRITSVRDTVPDGKWLQRTYGYSSGSVLSSVQYGCQGGSITTETYSYANGHNTGITLPGGTVVWSLTSENDLGLPTAITSGSINREYGYTAFGLPAYRRMNNGIIQNCTYQFNALTGNLTSRSDLVNGTTESFGYDALNRLVSMGNRQLSYAANGNILSIDGVGTMAYGAPFRPYQITMLEPEDEGIVPDRQQSITYTSFNRPSTLAEGGRSASFIYNGDGDRVRMSVADSTGSVLTRYYIGDRYELDVTPSGAKERLYLGGDAYSAPMVYQKTDSTSWTAYNIGRDYLGNITQIATASGTLVAEYSYDPWGRLRNPSTQEVYASGSEPELFLGRGFTGHEHLSWFGLVNMNARLYDPLLGRFLSPDPYVQAPDFTQNFNRYSYALNNPLRYTDETGEYTGWDDLFAALVGGTINWATNGCLLTWEGLGYFGVGAAAGVASLYVSPVAIAGLAAASNSIIRQGKGDDGKWSLQNVRAERVFLDGAIGLTTAYVGGKASSLLSNSLGKVTSKIPGKAWEGMVNRGITCAGTGFVAGSGMEALNQWGQYKETGFFDWDSVWKGGMRGALIGLTVGEITGMAEGAREARQQYKNPWNGKDWYPNNNGFSDTPTIGILSEGIYDRFGADNGTYLAPENTPFEQRSIPSAKNDMSIYNRYKVVKPIPNVEIGVAAPWFGYPGGGYQYHLPHSIQFYLDNGYIIKL